MSEAEYRVAAWLKAWDAQGIHRTGTAGDGAGAEWLAAEARALGAEVRVEDFALERLDHDRTDRFHLCAALLPAGQRALRIEVERDHLFARYCGCDCE